MPYEDRFLVDSMPVPVCQISRAARARICRQHPETAPTKGYCASQDQWYYGYKLHTVCTLDGVVTSLDLSPANAADIPYLHDIKAEYAHCIIYGDKGYLGHELQLDLFANAADSGGNADADQPAQLSATTRHYSPGPETYRNVLLATL